MTARLSPDLPVAAVLAEAVAASRSGAAIVTAPPGSGKTMLVPAAILDDLPNDQKLVLVQPRRLAARAVARRIAHLRGGEVGGEVGYHVRFDAQVGRDTRLVVVTTGILLRRLLDDILLEGIGAVVLDEFHERTIEMDLALGMLVRIRQTLRPDLRIGVMSATLSAEPVSRLLGGCPIVHAEGRRFPVQVRYLRRGEKRNLEEHVAAQLPYALQETTGHVLVFLPGVGEIMRCQRALAPLAEREGHALMPLYGDLSAEMQDQVLDDIGRRKIILSTNVAETSLTIEGVTAVIDSGQARQLQVSSATGLPRLELVPISQASAEQRAGRAGAPHPAFAGGCGKKRLTNRAPRQIRQRFCAAIWPNRCCTYSHSVNNMSFPGSIRLRRKQSGTHTSFFHSSVQSMTNGKSPRWAAFLPQYRPIRDWLAYSWPVPSAACCEKLRLPPRCFPNATHFERLSAHALARENMVKCEAARTSSIVSSRYKPSTREFPQRTAAWKFN